MREKLIPRKYQSGGKNKVYKFIPDYKPLTQSNAVPKSKVDKSINFYSNWIQARFNQLKNNMIKAGYKNVTDQDVYNELQKQITNLVTTGHVYEDLNSNEGGVFKTRSVITPELMQSGIVPGKIVIGNHVKNTPYEPIVETHETTHSGTRDDAPQLTALSQYGPLVNDWYIQNGYIDNNEYEYLNRPNEEYATIMAFRDHFKLDPKKTYTVNEIQNYVSQVNRDPNLKFLKPVIMYDINKFTKALNEIAYQDNGLNNDTYYAKHGLKLISKKRYVK